MADVINMVVADEPEIKTCGKTGLAYVIVGGRLFVERRPLAESGLNYFPVDALKRVGVETNDHYAEREWKK